MTGLSVEASGMGCDFAEDQKIGRVEAIKNLNLSCNSSNLFACLFVVLRRYLRKE